jgi:hypothetical protein
MRYSDHEQREPSKEEIAAAEEAFNDVRRRDDPGAMRAALIAAREVDPDRALKDAARVMFAALKECEDAYKNVSGMGSAYEMQRAMSSVRAALALARGETR